MKASMHFEQKKGVTPLVKRLYHFRKGHGLRVLLCTKVTFMCHIVFQRQNIKNAYFYLVFLYTCMHKIQNKVEFCSLNIFRDVT